MTQTTWTQLAIPFALGLSGLKVCKDCGETKPHASFSRQAGYRDGYRSNCKACVALRSKRWVEANPVRAAQTRRAYYEANRDAILTQVRAKTLERRYGITREQYNALLAVQGFRCAVCKTSDPGSKHRTFAVDHCHRTGAVRGLLCNNCNIGMGRLRDDPDLVLAARAYIVRHRSFTQGAA